MGCTETVPLCTNARQRRRQQTFTLPLHFISHKQTTGHFTVLSILSYSSFYFFKQDLIVNEPCTVKFLWSVVCSEMRKVLGLCFSWAPCFGFTWPRSSTPPSTHSWPTERFTAASAFQMRHSNRKDTPTLELWHHTLQRVSAVALQQSLENSLWKPASWLRRTRAHNVGKRKRRATPNCKEQTWRWDIHYSKDPHFKAIAAKTQKFQTVGEGRKELNWCVITNVEGTVHHLMMAPHIILVRQQKQLFKNSATYQNNQAQLNISSAFRTRGCEKRINMFRTEHLQPFCICILTIWSMIFYSYVQ